MSTLLKRCCDCNGPIGNRDKFCPRCGTRQPRAPASLVLGLSLLCAGIPGAHAANGGGDYPTKPVRVIVTFAPGGGTDLMARTIGQKLADAWGKPFVVDNRAGAGGIIGTEIAARAAPDGYTLLLASYGAEAQASTPEGLARFMREESSRARKVIASIGIKAE
jgi:hypothetical protein